MTVIVYMFIACISLPFVSTELKWFFLPTSLESVFILDCSCSMARKWLFGLLRRLIIIRVWLVTVFPLFHPINAPPFHANSSFLDVPGQWNYLFNHPTHRASCFITSIIQSSCGSSSVTASLSSVMSVLHVIPTVVFSSQPKLPNCFRGLIWASFAPHHYALVYIIRLRSYICHRFDATQFSLIFAEHSMFYAQFYAQRSHVFVSWSLIQKVYIPSNIWRDCCMLRCQILIVH